MNKFTAIGIQKDGSTLYEISDKVNSELMDRILRIVYKDATYMICEGHVKSISGAVPNQLLVAAKKWLAIYLKDEDSYTFYSETRINILKEYIKAAEAQSVTASIVLHT
jgi:hypothetical protein